MTLVEDLKEPLPTANIPHEYKRLPPTQRGYAKEYDQNFLKRMVGPHVNSYNFFLQEGLNNIVKYAEPYTFTLSGFTTSLTFTLKNLKIGTPQYQCGNETLPLTPQISREQSISYTAPMVAEIETVMGGQKFSFVQPLGIIPIMVGSTACVLHNKTPEQKIMLREDEREAGGYFLSNGTERLIRMVVVPKHLACQNMLRSAYLKRGSAFTEYAISFRDRRDDCRSQTIVLHALKDGSCTVRILIEKREYFVPLCLLLKAIKPTTDWEIYNSIVNNESEVYIIERVEMMLRDFHQMKLHTQNDALAYLGSSFRNICYRHRSDLSDVQVGEILLQRHVFFSMNNKQKFDLLCNMARRLYLFTDNQLIQDNQDSTANHDVLLPGHLFTAFMSENVETFLQSASYACMKHHKEGKFEYSEEFFKKKGVFKSQVIEQKFRSLISTGNLLSASGLDLLQQDSFSVTADRLNFVRFMAHFRSIHRGKFFAEMKTTAVRKMLPESYGFLCPVHTPDGAPCGLLNHLGYACSVVHANDSIKDEILMKQLMTHGVGMKTDNSIPVMLNGKIIGEVDNDEAQQLVNYLRQLKCSGQINNTTEIALVPGNNKFQLFPQLTIITKNSRYTRQVFNLAQQSVEQISPFEQLFLDIQIYDNEFNPQTTHQELSPITMLSTVASLVPFPDHNQSPRNMYECQMLKQTMGFPARSIGYRTDSKNYRILTPQRPMVHTCSHGMGGFDSHPTGTNAVVAVLSYSGYDMEDACLINKSSLERGLFNGTVYQCEDIDLVDDLGLSKNSEAFAYFKSDGTKDYIDADGLPKIGSVITTNDCICQYYDPTTNKIREKHYESREIGIVEKVIVTRDNTIKLPTRCKIIIRHDRSPIIGDKFASRHGQKGTLGIKFHGRDMPFSHFTGIAPDLIINPHAFPSRMTIGMLLESLGGKLSSQTGKDTDATPFQYSAEHRALDVLGNQLEQYGFCKYGSDIMYSGVTGEMMPVSIFIGVVYYQRLRHMVNDKYQVRGTGKVDQVTHQPIKGRKRGGGTRFGEMERDALLAHGTQQLLRGRLCTDSDAQVFRVCEKCGNILNQQSDNCSLCGGELRKIVMPNVTGVLIGELAGMGVFMGVGLQ
ncbi:DNA-directed_RNA polymerase subunit beta [Hexamita inflata]|uniref:DNA-directed RNA polymerase subunit beta n=1 Tax=Hexamita inflata TaxID=28002 RepID=A0ABP1JFW5_9EUKA